MRTIYVDFENRCHVADDGTMTAVETDFFDGKCEAYVEGYCMEISEAGKIQKVYPWKPDSELETAQQIYERALIVDMRSALNKLGVTLDE